MPQRMPYNNIADAINTWAEERCHSARIEDTTPFIVTEDLSNIVDVGTAIYNANWVDSFVKSMILQIGRWIFVNRAHRRWTPDITREGSEFGHVLAKTRTKRFLAKPNPTMHMNAGDTPNQFQFNPPTVKNKYFRGNVALFRHDPGSAAERHGSADRRSDNARNQWLHR